MLIISITSGVVSFLVAYNLIRSFSIVSNWVVGYTIGQVDHHSSHYQLPIVSNQTSDDDKFKLKKKTIKDSTFNILLSMIYIKPLSMLVLVTSSNPHHCS